MRKSIQHYPGIFATLVGCVFALTPLLALETLFYLRAMYAPDNALAPVSTPPPPQPKIETDFPKLLQPDDRHGFRARANESLTDTLTRDGEEIFTVTYTTDANGFRNTPVPPNDERPLIAAFFGCSMTFGVGCNNDETLPARFAAYAPNYLPLNFAMYGYGPQNTWLLLDEEPVQASLRNKSGIAFYVYIDDHVYRLVGPPSPGNEFRHMLPWLDFDGENIFFRGLLNQRTPKTNIADKVIDQSHFLRAIYSWTNKPITSTRLALDSKPAQKFFAAVMADCRRKLQAIAPEIKFMVVGYPARKGVSNAADLLKPVKVNALALNYHELSLDMPPTEVLYKDLPNPLAGHPKPIFHDAVAEYLANAVGAAPNANDVPEEPTDNLI